LLLSRACRDIQSFVMRAKCLFLTPRLGLQNRGRHRRMSPPPLDLRLRDNAACNSSASRQSWFTRAVIRPHACAVRALADFELTL
jgi:hypothetical protein